MKNIRVQGEVYRIVKTRWYHYLLDMLSFSKKGIDGHKVVITAVIGKVIDVEKVEDYNSRQVVTSRQPITPYSRKRNR
jgi:hypothetical protein